MVQGQGGEPCTGVRATVQPNVVLGPGLLDVGPRAASREQGLKCSLAQADQPGGPPFLRGTPGLRELGTEGGWGHEKGLAGP